MLTASELDIESLDIKSLPRVRLSDRRNLPDAPGVYFVIDDRAVPVYYIGQAESLKKRWVQHNKIKVFEHYDSDESPMFICYLGVEGSRVDLLAVETQAIKHFVPLMNYQTRGFLMSKPFAAPQAVPKSDTPPSPSVDATEKTKTLDIPQLFKDLRSFSRHKPGFALPNSLAIEVKINCDYEDELWFERNAEDLMHVLEVFLFIFFTKVWGEMDALAPSTKKIFSLMVATSLNKSRHEFMARSGLIRDVAAEKITGVGSIQSTWDGHLSLCVSESYRLPEDTSLSDVLDDSEEDNEPGTLETVDVFLDTGNEFRSIF